MREKNAPKLRFNGFLEDWEQRKLNEVSDIYDGTHQTPKYQDEGVMFLSVENIKTLISNKFISHEAFESEFRIRPQRGDVLITRIGDVGTANVVETDENLAYYVSLALLKSEKLQSYFLQASIHAPFVQKQIWKRTLHIAFPKKINKNEIGQVPINIPTTDEQDRIGTFFKQLDDTIALHQRKIDSLKLLKHAFLQKMLVNQGFVPEVRFADFDEKWTQHKLGDITKKIGSGKTPRGGNATYLNHGIRLIRSQNIFENFVHFDDVVFISNEVDEGMKNSRVQKNDILLNITGASIGRSAVYQLSEKSNVNQHVCIIRPKNKYDPKFIQLNISSQNGQKKIELNQAGGGREGLNFQQISKMTFVYPSYQEQKQISLFLQIIENTIDLYQKKLNNLNQLKKVFLQSMFI